MELWIRSQTKILLKKVDELIIKEHSTFTEEYEVEDFAICNEKYVFGAYKTKERCVEILDEIQRFILNSDKTILTTSSNLDKKTYDGILEEVEKNKFTILCCPDTPQVLPINTNIVYQMPEK